jgi:hypothetical protein
MNMSNANSKYRILIGFAAVIVLMVMVAAMGIMGMAENNRGMLIHVISALKLQKHQRSPI